MHTFGPSTVVPNCNQNQVSCLMPCMWGGGGICVWNFIAILLQLSAASILMANMCEAFSQWSLQAKTKLHGQHVVT